MFKDEPSSKFVNEYEGIETAQLAPPQTFEQAAKRVTELCAEVAAALAPYVKQVVDTLFPIVEAYTNLVAAALKTFPNRRVVHLALHAKKPRTRKKNQKRILEWMGRGELWR